MTALTKFQSRRGSQRFPSPLPWRAARQHRQCRHSNVAASRLSKPVLPPARKRKRAAAWQAAWEPAPLIRPWREATGRRQAGSTEGEGRGQPRSVAHQAGAFIAADRFRAPPQGQRRAHACVCRCKIRRSWPGRSIRNRLQQIAEPNRGPIRAKSHPGLAPCAHRQ